MTAHLTGMIFYRNYDEAKIDCTLKLILSQAVRLTILGIETHSMVPDQLYFPYMRFGLLCRKH